MQCSMYCKSLMVHKRCANKSCEKKTVQIGVERNEFRGFRRSLGKKLISILSWINKNLDQEWHSIISSTPLFKNAENIKQQNFSITFTLVLCRPTQSFLSCQAAHTNSNNKPSQTRISHHKVRLTQCHDTYNPCTSDFEAIAPTLEYLGVWRTKLVLPDLSFIFSNSKS
jgi:hypothetical protein